MMGHMVPRTLMRVALAVVIVAGAAGAVSAEDPAPKPAPSIIMDLVNRPLESQEQAFNQALKAEALAPAPSPVDQWEVQPDGSVRNKKTGISMIVRNPCPPGDIEHEFALAAYNRALARSKPRH